MIALTEILGASTLGLAAGLLGGLAGIGGSILILPGLGMLFGYPTANAHHGYMASAMTVNLVVAIPAALRHHQHKAVRVDLLPGMVVTTGLAVAAGVIASNLVAGWQLQIVLAASLIAFSIQTLLKAFRRAPDREAPPERITKARVTACGGLGGFPAGLLGLGGGLMNVPLFQSLLGLPLRTAIATSSALICLTAPIGAGLKLASLAGLGEAWTRALLLAALMAPGAVVGARMGATLTHRLPLMWVRIVIALMLILASGRLLVAGGRMGGWW